MNKNQIASLSKLNGLIVHHPQFECAYKQINECYELKNAGLPVNFLCLGMSGTGKTTLKEKFLNQHLPYQTRDRKIVPVLVVDIPSLPTVKNVSEAVLLELGDPLFNRGTAIEKTNRILTLVKTCKVQLIIFDELQHFVDQGSKSTPSQAADWLKTIIDRSNASVVLMGLQRSEHILRLNEQLRRRFSRRINLEPFSLAKMNSYWDFVRVLRAMLKVVDMQEETNLSDNLVRRIHYATNGVIGYMQTLLMAAFRSASSFGRSHISEEDFEAAFTESIWSAGIGTNNPFNEDFVFKRLIKPGMPFHRLMSPEEV
ncbi:TniB family NTP-binding protein [Neptuniibacter sp. 2_MG-2023]|uniref:TniB family NTP-binding protein n=1 Tax=Neptuniibacter sp. 2_MG-2023 TaxID=3062671 RepID=UPI0026E1A556|nr:TniB family NTP-binding protein [Neptuniibacter sp. 2_MG-2023]MDO6514045.1 TniB family NTP-binding protein [Neptuniibacter sp. 2_MG-2023]